MAKAPKQVTTQESTLKPSQIYEAMQWADKIKDSLMIWGSPGIGKSEMAKMYANEFYPVRSSMESQINVMNHKIKIMQQNLSELDENSDDYADLSHNISRVEDMISTMSERCLDQETNFIDFRLSQIEPSDLRGIPIPVKFYTDKKSGKHVPESLLKEDGEYEEHHGVVWAAPEVFNLPVNWKGVIMFDEINSAMPIVQAAAYQFVLDRRIGELELPKGAFILAAGNRDGDGGVTFQLATPLRDRMTHVEMRADYIDWRDHYAIPNNVSAKVIAWLESRAEDTFNTLSKDEIGHAGGTSPRSWVTVSNYEKAIEGGNASKAVYKSLVHGRLGPGVGGEYIVFSDKLCGMPTPADILNGVVTKVDDATVHEPSRMYFISHSMVLKLNEMYDEMVLGNLEKDKFNKMADNFCKFYLDNFSLHHSTLIILAVRMMTQRQIFLVRANVPHFGKIVQQYGDDLKRARNSGGRH